MTLSEKLSRGINAAENGRKAEARAIEVWRHNFVAFCPHMNSAFFDGLVPDEFFLAGTMEMLRRCDGLIVVPGWSKSEGTKAEIRWCFDNGVPVFSTIKGLINWAPVGRSEVYAHLNLDEIRQAHKNKGGNNGTT